MDTAILQLANAFDGWGIALYCLITMSISAGLSLVIGLERELKGEPAGGMSDQMKFAAAVVEAGMLLRGSEFKGSATYTSALELARGSSLVTGDPYKEEFVYLLTLLERNSQI